MSPRNAGRRDVQSNEAGGRHEWDHVVFPDIIEYPYSPTFNNPRFGGGDLFPERPFLSPSFHLGGPSAFSSIGTGTPQTRTQDLDSSTLSALKILNKAQETRHENPHAPESSA
jgi:hypothetical protein